MSVKLSGRKRAMPKTHQQNDEPFRKNQKVVDDAPRTPISSRVPTNEWSMKRLRNFAKRYRLNTTYNFPLNGTKQTLLDNILAHYSDKLLTGSSISTQQSSTASANQDSSPLMKFDSLLGEIFPDARETIATSEASNTADDSNDEATEEEEDFDLEFEDVGSDVGNVPQVVKSSPVKSQPSAQNEDNEPHSKSNGIKSLSVRNSWMDKIFPVFSIPNPHSHVWFVNNASFDLNNLNDGNATNKDNENIAMPMYFDGDDKNWQASFITIESMTNYDIKWLGSVKYQAKFKKRLNESNVENNNKTTLNWDEQDWYHQGSNYWNTILLDYPPFDDYCIPKTNNCNINADNETKNEANENKTESENESSYNNKVINCINDVVSKLKDLGKSHFETNKFNEKAKSDSLIRAKLMGGGFKVLLNKKNNENEYGKQVIGFLLYHKVFETDVQMGRMDCNWYDWRIDEPHVTFPFKQLKNLKFIDQSYQLNQRYGNKNKYFYAISELCVCNQFSQDALFNKILPNTGESPSNKSIYNKGTIEYQLFEHFLRNVIVNDWIESQNENMIAMHFNPEKPQLLEIYTECLDNVFKCEEECKVEILRLPPKDNFYDYLDRNRKSRVFIVKSKHN